ncbi:Heat shock protein HslJ (HslJ) (PDB:2KTS) [Commensalibacter communis]|uniref:META domain-containing protein n=1 Tax=Commensalibacter communis TaxID=2972786 RepID=UPI0022FF639D|nr:META domain-containing protein [Commensalibacter communis]CAI3941882.1 Heat shock protein HslJ (HslJ) (PDB:2KTS) [Commensalibacter communis]CAI3943205.1 Heat shock protein HslJ (HslJ) (PDB:2KTS) [Commensalibacter communis]
MLKKLFIWIINIQIILGSGFAYAQTTKTKSPFDESVWRIESLYNQPKTIQTYQGEKNYASISFNPYTRKIIGRGLCNKFIGKFKQKVEKVTIRGVITTHEKCLSNDVNAQDDRFFSYLQSVQSYSIHGKILRLKDAQNNTLITARWAK